MRVASSVVAIGCIGAVLGWLAPAACAAEMQPIALQPRLVFALPCDGGSGHQSHLRIVHIGAFVLHLHVSGGVGQPASAGFAFVLDPARVNASKSLSTFAPRAARCRARQHLADLTPDAP